MEENESQHNEEQQHEDELKDENAFLKMKMMLEKGADFHMSEEIPPEIENQFLKNIMDFEDQWSNVQTIKLYDKIEQPTQFKPVAELSDEEIETAYEELLDHMEKYGIQFDCCSPNISKRELYRFVTEELFEDEINDMRIPGMMSCFTYDEYYPDPVYDNSKNALSDCINRIFEKSEMEFLTWYPAEKIQLNSYTDLDREAFKKKINSFKANYTNIELIEAEVDSCTLENDKYVVKGHFEVDLFFDEVLNKITDKFTIDFYKQEDSPYWEMHKIMIAGVLF
jgi:hypothetical protein